MAGADIDKETEGITVDLITGTGRYHNYFRPVKTGNMLEKPKVNGQITSPQDMV